MKENELKEMKLEYERLVHKREKLKPIREKLDELEKNVLIQEYIKLSREYNSLTANFLDEDITEKNDYDFIERVVHYNKITPTTNIYFYAGSATRDKDGDLDIKDRKDDNADFFRFYNIEERSEFHYTSVVPSNLSNFTAKNIVVYPTVLRNCGMAFDEARIDFFKTAIMEGQDKAFQKFIEYSKSGYPWRPNI